MELELRFEDDVGLRPDDLLYLLRGAKEFLWFQGEYFSLIYDGLAEMTGIVCGCYRATWINSSFMQVHNAEVLYLFGTEALA